MSKMKKAPCKMLVCIVDKDKASVALDILKNAKESFNIISLVETQERSSGIMGLNRQESVMIAGLVRSENASRILQGLDLVLCPNDKSFGIAYTINMSSMSRETLNFFIAKHKEDV
ncbi:MAG: hypothetical protein IJ301_01425 [Clostridia bacterium]|nr:hypothetical protein [Clostridia bacterium]